MKPTRQGRGTVMHLKPGVMLANIGQRWCGMGIDGNQLIVGIKGLDPATQHCAAHTTSPNHNRTKPQV